MINIVSFLCGLVFAIGLCLSGMTQAEKIVNFLDFTSPSWDPSLFLVMFGGVLVYYLSQRLILRRGGPLIGTRFILPTKVEIEGPMVAGNVLFGIGWGLVGFCPGPALTASVTLNPQVLTFLVSMSLGMFLFGSLHTRFTTREPDGGAGAMEMIAAKR